MAVAAEAALDRRVLRLLGAGDLEVLRPRPRVEDERRSSGRAASSRARSRTGPTPGSASSGRRARRRGVRLARPRASRSSSPEATEAASDWRYARGSRRGRRPCRTSRRRRPSPPESGTRRPNGPVVCAGGRLAEVLDERADHAHGRRPRAVRRADRLHDVLEDRRAAEHPAGPARHPGELGVVAAAS